METRLAIVKSISDDTPDPNNIGLVIPNMELRGRTIMLVGNRWTNIGINPSHQLCSIDGSERDLWYDNNWFTELKSI